MLTCIYHWQENQMQRNELWGWGGIEMYVSTSSKSSGWWTYWKRITVLYISHEGEIAGCRKVWKCIPHGLLLEEHDGELLKFGDGSSTEYRSSGGERIE